MRRFLTNRSSLIGRLLATVALAVVSSAAIPAAQQASAQGPKVDAKIEIVWPHDEQGNPAPVATALLVNVEVYLFERGTLNPVRCDFPNDVTLRWARNIHDPRPGVDYLAPAHDLPGWAASAVGQRIIEHVGDKTFPAWVFNDVPTGFDPLLRGSTTYFFVEVEAVDYRTNVWAHTVDARTNLPDQRRPVSVDGSAPSVVDAHSGCLAARCSGHRTACGWGQLGQHWG